MAGIIFGFDAVTNQEEWRNERIESRFELSL